RQLIPKNTDNQAKLSTGEFSRITKIASLFARESGGSVTIKTNPDDSTVSIDSIASQQGESSSAASAEVTGEGQITLNSRYLIEALGCIDDATLSFGFSGKLAPCVLKPVESDDYQHIIMPLKS
ncbi:MAG TPA: DNA polymerase III subunit beta, partial [Candidatus Saccharimonadales bacterium]|nr:DNA polymerase III subunit beta [Candidatus Saccharimonadales bacterium]